MKMKLDMQHKHVMRLVERDADEEGWAKISEQLFDVLAGSMPSELVIFEKLNNGGRARLTEEGSSVLSAMDWI